jgi:hypothetical protein
MGILVKRETEKGNKCINKNKNKTQACKKERMEDDRNRREITESDHCSATVWAYGVLCRIKF